MADSSTSQTNEPWYKNPSWWTVGFIFIFVVALLAAIALDARVLRRFADNNYARGVITFVISLSAIGIAFFMVYQAFFVEATTKEEIEERFRHAREIFTGLMGVLGTIVGFYFGSTQTGAGQLEIADIRRANREIATFVTGGTRPYSYRITADGQALAAKNSEDGLIVDTLPETVGASATVILEVTDSQGRKNVRELKGITAPPAPSDADKQK